MNSLLAKGQMKLLLTATKKAVIKSRCLPHLQKIPGAAAARKLSSLMPGTAAKIPAQWRMAIVKRTLH